MRKALTFIILALMFNSCGSSLSSIVAADDYAFKKTSTIARYDRSMQPKKSPVTLASQFIWGINGHPIDSPAYFADNSTALQYNLLNEFQMDYYRINVITDENGQVTIYPSYARRWKETLAASVKNKVKLLPVFHLKDYDPTMTIDEAYKIAKKKAYGFASAHKDYFDYYELGNERDLRLIFPNTDGDKIEHYDLPAFDVMISYFKGLHDGVKEADPTSKTLINSAGWKHWGFFEYLQQNNTPYDIISWHWYSNQGTVFNPLIVKTTGEDVLKLLNDRFKKPIWITEINQIDGTYNESEDNMAFWNNSFVDDLKNREYVQGYFVYELLDQQHLDDNIDYEHPKEAYYGLIKWEESFTKYSYKTAALTYKYKIEDIAHGSEDYIIHLYTTFNRDRPAKNQLEQEASQVVDNTNMSLLLDSFLSKELMTAESPGELKMDAQTKMINQLYQKVLKRDASPENQKHWQKTLKKGATEKEIIKSLLTSKEFYQKAVIAGYENRTEFPFYRDGVYNIKDQK